MLDVLLSVVDSGIDYKVVMVLGLGYLILLWLVFSFWVLNDARKRYKNPLVALIFFWIVLVLNFPALIFYLIIRPEKEDENTLHLYHHDEVGGLNVPLVNFASEQGISMSLQIKLAPGVLKATSSDDLEVNVKVKEGLINKVVKSEAGSTSQIEEHSAGHLNDRVKTSSRVLFAKGKKAAGTLRSKLTEVASSAKKYSEAMDKLPEEPKASSPEDSKADEKKESQVSK